jgi:hypothetical protein
MTTRAALGVAPPTDGTGKLAQDGTGDRDRPPEASRPTAVPAAMSSRVQSRQTLRLSRHEIRWRNR